MPLTPSIHLSAIGKWIAQFPPVEWTLHNVRELLLASLRQGKMPQHIAFVMDGNRRYARKNGIEIVEGHNLGFETLARVLEVCYKSGVRVVTVYAFSIENFKRSKFEVEALMEMAKTKISELALHGELLDRYGAKIQFLGQKDLIRPDVLEAIDQAIDMTSKNSRAILNICAPYTSRDEMTAAIRSTVAEYCKPAIPLKRPFSATHIARNLRTQHLGDASGEEGSYAAGEGKHGHSESDHLDAQQVDNHAESIASSRTSSPYPSASSQPSADTTSTTAPSNGNEFRGHLPRFHDVENITADTLEAHTFTAGMPPLDLLVRTSGVERLSDFMLWQCHQKTEIVFVDCLWPEFDLWKFMPILLEWQWRQQRGDDVIVGKGKRRHRSVGFPSENPETTLTSGETNIVATA